MLQSVIAQHIAKVRQQVEQACHKFARNPIQVKILAVSKKQPATAIREAAATGQKAFGENYLQEGLQKQQELADLDLEWHFVGPIQSNKTRDLAENFAWVHTLDRFKVARRLSEQRPEKLPPLQVLIQVNISDEASKSGVAASDALVLAEQVMVLPHLELRGLMCIPAATDDYQQQRATFAQMAALQKRLQAAFPAARLDTLSMGMSGDLEAAIAEGSTLVRIGTAIFGARQ
ncbi:YggS family pyridoxal phosphate-dependent enzyme [Marinospirillum sp.]|uniref:YggS family pyridoxal phosphate-dependent enzyme n=1 Tax=Marinospirillum sp. TaxID=2183934 RepID=UPI002870AA26|nr:YggS family pyridoxal phosphate-dependent enzyme [Marinospirillum sp.]MDR9466951.1 YggS family pyridoxal phosphate-dependent enzyme [Marinospirillum sp.]